MAVLLLRCSGPMQSWGTQSRFKERDTGLEPSKSGIVGLLCAALGRPRSGPVDDLARLRMGVRVDREGLLMNDFHTAMNVAKAGGGPPKETETSNRYYLSDADFLVGLEGDDLELLRRCHEALKEPVWPLSLGRKAFPPGLPVWIPEGFKDSKKLEEALSIAVTPWESRSGENPPDRLRAVLEDPEGPEVRSDFPVGAAFEARRFTLRHVRTEFWATGFQAISQEAAQ